MLLPFKENYRLTQGFGVNKDDYIKYNLQGHNGLDHAVPCFTPLYAMISGIIKEVADEGNIGYGKYIKIENDIEGSLVAHLSSQSVAVGQQVVAGVTLIGKSGTTGNSSGCHTHTGYYRFPRNRQNGFSGYIDPTPYLEGGGSTVADMYKGYDLSNRESMKVAVDVLVRVQAGEFVDKPKYDAGIKALNQQITDLKNKPIPTSESDKTLAELKAVLGKVLK